jgi:predicted nucleotide-binding protein
MNTVLRIPLADARAQLQQRIEAASELLSSKTPNLEAREELTRRIKKWRDYNHSWFDKNLRGEAATEYLSVSSYWPRLGVTLTYRAEGKKLHKAVVEDVAVLQSVHDRLPLWVPEAQAVIPGPETTRLTPGAPIFIVHGSDTLRAESIAHTVERATRRETIILREQPNLGQTLIEKFEQHATQASYAIIVLTPDDHGSRNDEPADHPRARQNVIFEMGYFYGIIGRRKVSVLLHPTVEKPSDTDGVAYITLDDNGTWKYELFRELRQADFDITL